MSAPPAIPDDSAIHPALRPITSTTMSRSWLSAVVWSRSIASVATCTAVANPMHASVPDRSLSIVFGMPTTGTPSDDMWAAAPIVPSPPIVTRASTPRSANVRRTRSTPCSWYGSAPEDPRIVPPRCRIPWTDAGVSSRTSPSITPRQPLRNPRTSNPCTSIAVRTTARIAAFRPGASPPAVRTPMRVVTRRAPVGSCLRSSHVVGLSRTWIVRPGRSVPARNTAARGDVRCRNDSWSPRSRSSP